MRDFGTGILADEDTEQDDATKSLMGFNNTLNLKPVQKKEIYLVTTKYDEINTGGEVKQLDYKVEIQFLFKSENDEYTFKVTKYDFFINRKEPSLIIEEIVEQISEAIYPLEISINNTGKLIRVNNLDEIDKRWLTIKSEIKKEYNSDIVEKLIQQFEKAINNSVKFEILLHKDMFWNVFFHKNYISYGSSAVKDSTILYPIHPNKTPLVYKGRNKINPVVTEYNTIEINFKGKTSIPEDYIFENTKKGEILTSDLIIDYDIDNTTSLPIWIKGNCSIIKEDTKENIKTLSFHIARLQGQQPRQIENSNIEKESDIELDKGKKKNFLKFLKK